MIKRIVSVLVMSSLLMGGAAESDAQSFLKQLGKEVHNAAKKAVVNAARENAQKNNQERKPASNQKPATRPAGSQQSEKARQSDQYIRSVESTQKTQKRMMVLPPAEHEAFFEPLGYPTDEGTCEWVCPAPPAAVKDYGKWAEGLKPVSALTNASLAKEVKLLESRFNRSVEIINAVIDRYDKAYNEFVGRANLINDMVATLAEINATTSNEAQRQTQAAFLVRHLSAPEYARAIKSSLVPLGPYLNDKTKQYLAKYAELGSLHKAPRTKWDPYSNEKPETSVGGAAVGKPSPDGKGVDVDGLKFKIWLKTAKGDFFKLIEVNKAAVEGKDVVIPSHIMYKGKAYPVTEIGSGVFAGTAAKSVTIPNTVNLIERSAFRNMTAMKTIEIPSSVKTIDAFAFAGSKELVEVIFPETIKKMDFFIFEGCPKLVNVVLPKNLKTIGMGLFKDCPMLKTVTLPQNLEAIPDRLFLNCKSLTNIKFPETVKAIGNEAFCGCSSITAFDLPSSLESVGMAAFKNCSKITSLYFPSSVTDIDGCIEGCKSLKTITLSSAYNNFYVLVGIFGGTHLFPESYFATATIPPAFKFEDNE